MLNHKITLRCFLAIALCCLFAFGCGGGGDSGSGSNMKDAIACGGSSGQGCLPNQFCKFQDFTCGQTGLPGVCVDIPLNCNTPAVPQAGETAVDTQSIQGPVCSCDQLDFHSECWADQAGQSLKGAGACP